MAEEETPGGPFWAPTNRFDLYAKDEDWRRAIDSIQRSLACEAWQAWVVQLLLCQANMMTSAMLQDMAEERRRLREPWEPEEEDEDE